MNFDLLLPPFLCGVWWWSIPRLFTYTLSVVGVDVCTGVGVFQCIDPTASWYACAISCLFSLPTYRLCNRGLTRSCCIILFITASVAGDLGRSQHRSLVVISKRVSLTDPEIQHD